MATNTYQSLDISGYTHFSNYGVRTRRAIGTGVHTTSGSNSVPYLQSDRRSVNKVSGTDYLIDRSGKRFQLTPHSKFAYHFGKAGWNYLSNNENLLSELYIGVELENLDTQLCTWQQLDSLAELVVGELTPLYNWAFPFDIVGHYEVAVPIGRRSDPLGFNWGHFAGYLVKRSFDAGMLPELEK